ncbi:MAG: hypothetical protein AB7S77_14260 [Desulfatirhabdiaceae bacterium]
MMKTIRKILACCILFVCLPYSGSAEEILFSENWESGTVDTARWVPFGYPSPVVVESGYNSAYALNVNGDAGVCESGVYSINEFSTETETIAVFYLKSQSVTGFASMDISAGLTSGTVMPGCETDRYFLYLANIEIVSSSLGGGIYYRTLSGGYYKENYIDDNWHKFTIRLLPDGAVYFYRDDVFKYSASIFDLTQYPKTRFQSGGQSQYGNMLIDAIQILATDATCNSDYNRDGITDELDIVDYAELEIAEMYAWITLCWQVQLSCGDYDGNGMIDNIDLIQKSIDTALEFIDWAYYCWWDVAKPVSSKDFQANMELIKHLEQRILSIVQQYQ